MGLQLICSASLVAGAPLPSEENFLPTPSTWGIRVWLVCEKLCRVLLCIGPRVSAYWSGVSSDALVPAPLLMLRNSCFQLSGSALCRGSFPQLGFLIC